MRGVYLALTTVFLASVISAAVRPSPGEEEAVDLGAALVPEWTAPERAFAQGWRSPGITPASYRVAHGLDEAEDARLMTGLTRLAEALHHQVTGPETFTVRVPQGACEAVLECVYQSLVESNADAVAPLALRFAQRAWSAGLSEEQATLLVLNYVQALEYRLPTELPFGLLPPGLVSSRGWGDCDSKALLAVLLLNQMGLPGAVLVSRPLRHAAVGLPPEGPGERFRAAGEDFRYVEVTNAGWAVGKIPPGYAKPRAWTVLRPRVVRRF